MKDEDLTVRRLRHGLARLAEAKMEQVAGEFEVVAERLVVAGVLPVEERGYIGNRAAELVFGHIDRFECEG